MKYKALITRKFVEYRRFIPLIVFSIVILIFAVKIGYVSDSNLVRLENDKFQSIQIQNLLTDKVINFDQIQGNYVLLHFFSPSCDKCISEIPELKKIHQANIKLIGVAISDDKEKVRNWLLKHGDYFTEVGMMDFDQALEFGINNFPETVILYKDKPLVYKFPGMINYTSISRITQQ
jgi:thiol-disulfide isomerase/thioredoxin